VRWPSGRRRRFAKRRSVCRPSSFFLANPRTSIISPIERLGCCWLRKPGLGSWQGQSWGQYVHLPHRYFPGACTRVIDNSRRHRWTKMLTLNEHSTSRIGAGKRSMHALAERAAALTEEQRQIRAALVGSFFDSSGVGPRRRHSRTSSGVASRSTSSGRNHRAAQASLTLSWIGHRFQTKRQWVQLQVDGAT
jgi:hypothetical protein